MSGNSDRREVTRRTAITTGAGIAALSAHGIGLAADTIEPMDQPASVDMRLIVNGRSVDMSLDPRMTLLDALRERLQLTGTKKGCDHGQCGACTVIVDGRRIYSCLTLAVMNDGSSVTTIEGVAGSDALHPLQAAFIDCDAFQCGYCTPGQICSAIAMLDEVAASEPSHVTHDLERVTLDAAELRERMSGNICRCGAYPNILEAIERVRAVRS